ncbi:hypothetical protein [Viridibacillus sp. FSL H8-0123]|uniref:hypothetical protein n=1 Tax=Viridibacillus sp. FSL H8-0123 TaxID=1928922 RepID=UPI00096C645A|nr:hypothetical protein [Viridibacillus sp. FSL H8-0123]OMC77258.1 hypothetical protein BK130_21605 [Viridibacillus sp. FSL H8-0123]
MSNVLPIISTDKNYWLVRTQGGKYYNEYRKEGFIAINWNAISIQDIKDLSNKELTEKIKKEFPEKQKPGRASSQLRIFNSQIKQGDTVIITSYGSNKFSIGEVEVNEPYQVEVDEKEIENNPKVCAYTKRKKVRWIKEIHKWDVEKPMFKLLQHARNTINDANDYADIIESMLHDFYIRGEKAQLSLEVKKDGKIPWDSFFSMGKEISDILKSFDEYSKIVNIDMDQINTQINVNSPGKIKLAGPFLAITAAGLLIVALTGGSINVQFPEIIGGGGLELDIPSILSEISDFQNQRQEREHEDLLLKTYMNELEVKTPKELEELMKAVNVDNTTKE